MPLHHVASLMAGGKCSSRTGRQFRSPGNCSEANICTASTWLRAHGPSKVVLKTLDYVKFLQRSTETQHQDRIPGWRSHSDNRRQAGHPPLEAAEGPRVAMRVIQTEQAQQEIHLGLIPQAPPPAAPCGLPYGKAGGLLPS